MQNKGSQNMDYNALVAEGLRLSEGNFNLILNALTEGANEAKNYLNAASDEWPKFNFSNDIRTLGYSSADDAICLSINHLNQAAERASQIEFKDQLIMFIPDVFYIVVKYTYWLKLLGREATIHRYQKKGSPQLQAKFPESMPALISVKQLLLSHLEVEARRVTDEISQKEGENPIWKSVDTYFSQKFPQYYNKSIDEIAKLPKPDFPISYEMEYYI